MSMSRKAAAAVVRDLANQCIEQMTRRANGWDKGPYRDDDIRTGHVEAYPINVTMRNASREAFKLSAEHAN